MTSAKAHFELRETGGKIDELGFHNTNAIVDQMMARLQVDEYERTATATQHATELASAKQANATMESQMKNLLDQVQDLQLANTPNYGNKYGRGRAQPSAPPTPK